MKPGQPLPVLVLGATGVVGRGVVAAAVQAGRPVVAVARDAAGLAQLAALHPQADITTLPGSVADDAEAAALAAALRTLPRVPAGIVVAISGTGARGRVLDQPAALLGRQIDQDLLPQLAAARHLLPLLGASGRGGSYVIIGGPGSALPWAGYGHRSVAAAALRMLARVLHDEARALGLRVQLLSVDVPVCTDGDRVHACPHWPTAVSIGARALALLERGDAAATGAIVACVGAAGGGARAAGDALAETETYVRGLVAGALDGVFADARTTPAQLPDSAPAAGPRSLQAIAAAPAAATDTTTAAPRAGDPSPIPQEASPR